MDWKKEDKKLVKEYVFKDFKEAVGFINNVLPIAEEQEHHPDILLHSYKKVKVMIYTHDKDRVTDKDYKLAKAIDKIDI